MEESISIITSEYIRKFYEVITIIMGASCTGKTTLVNNLKERHEEVDLYVPIKKIKVRKFKNFLLVQQSLTNNFWTFTYADSISEIKEILQKEYSNNNNILFEVEKPTLNKNFLYWLIDEYKVKIIHLTTSIDILNERAKIRNLSWDKKRTDRKTINQTKRIVDLLNDNKIKKYVTTLPNVSETDFKNNLDTLDAFMT